jgi:hypothetical protein
MGRSVTSLLYQARPLSGTACHAVQEKRPAQNKYKQKRILLICGSILVRALAFSRRPCRRRTIVTSRRTQMSNICFVCSLFFVFSHCPCRPHTGVLATTLDVVVRSPVDACVLRVVLSLRPLPPTSVEGCRLQSAGFEVPARLCTRRLPDPATHTTRLRAASFWLQAAGLQVSRFPPPWAVVVVDEGMLRKVVDPIQSLDADPPQARPRATQPPVLFHRPVGICQRLLAMINY